MTIPQPIPAAWARSYIESAGGRKVCAARLRVNQRTVMRWETGRVPMPYAIAVLLLAHAEQTIPNLPVDILSQ